MKKHVFFTLLSVCLLGFSGQADAQSKADCFKMQSTNGLKEIPVEKLFTGERGANVLKIFDGIDALYGLSVTMDVTRLSDNFLVRILLEDADGHKHLVAESYKEIATVEKKLQFSDYCEETALLGGVKPIALHIITDNVVVNLNSIRVSIGEKREQKSGTNISEKQVANLRKQQVEAKVFLINIYNETNNKLWRAGVTAESLLPFDIKMRVEGSTYLGNTHGIEYYVSGIFSVGQDENQSAYLDPPGYEYPQDHIDEFDWTNRHGINWMNAVKDQGNSGFCSGFSTASVLEAMTNLYFNKKMSIDLSPSQLMLCSDLPVEISSNNPYLVGADVKDIIEYAVGNDVVDAISYPFIDDLNDNCRLDSIMPNYTVRPSGYTSLRDSTEAQIMRWLTHNGPLISGCITDYLKHAMALVGFKRIQIGDTICYSNVNYEPYEFHIVNDNDTDYINHICWKFQNSHGINPNGSIRSPYIYMLFNNRSQMVGPYAFNTPITVTDFRNGSQIIVPETEIVCEDKDGDGFYNWGIGQRPSHCSEYALSKPDGEDVAPLLGPIDSENNIMCLDPDRNDTVFVENFLEMVEMDDHIVHCYSHFLLENGETAHTPCPIYFHNGAKIIVQSGCTLSIDGHILYNADVVMESGSRLVINNGGRLILPNGKTFSPPLGAIVEIHEGSIEPFISHFPYQDISF